MLPHLKRKIVFLNLQEYILGPGAGTFSRFRDEQSSLQIRAAGAPNRAPGKGGWGVVLHLYAAPG